MKIPSVLKSGWVLVAGTAGVLTYLLTNGPTLLENARKIPVEFMETKKTFLS